MTATSSQPDITMIICTRNRAEQLSRVLDSAVRFRVPHDLTWEFLVIDNGSSDGTDRVVRAFQDRLPVRVVREDRAGLSNARNRGVAEAAGRYICWTDDDVLLDAGWLAAYWTAFQEHPEAAIFGGRITPVLESPVVAWFSGLRTAWPVSILLAERDFGDTPRPLDCQDGIMPFGANFAIRTLEQRQVLYDPGLGVSPHHRRVGEEAEVMFQLMSAGATGWWTPDARVDHLIPLARQTWDYIYDYASAFGETLTYMQAECAAPHHLSEAPERSRVNQSRLRMRVNGLAYRSFATVARGLGAYGRSARFLAVAGHFAGALRYRANAKPKAGR